MSVPQLFIFWVDAKVIIARKISFKNEQKILRDNNTVIFLLINTIETYFLSCYDHDIIIHNIHHDHPRH
jgi:hypothetical protein